MDSIGPRPDSDKPLIAPNSHLKPDAELSETTNRTGTSPLGTRRADILLKCRNSVVFPLGGGHSSSSSRINSVILRTFYHVRGELQTARELGEQLLSLAQNVQDTALIVRAHRMLGDTLLWLGELVSAQAHLEQGIALYDPEQHRSHMALYGSEPGVFGLSFAALAQWFRGYPDQAAQRIRAALTLAQELSYPRDIVSALFFAAQVSQARRDGPLTHERVEAIIVLATEQGFTQRLHQATILHCWALTMQGQKEKGIAEMRQALAAQRE